MAGAISRHLKPVDAYLKKKARGTSFGKSVRNLVTGKARIKLGAERRSFANPLGVRVEKRQPTPAQSLRINK